MLINYFPLNSFHKRSKYIARYLRNMLPRKIPVPITEKRLDITIIGTPNSGKSTLLNCLINNRLAACNRKSHTTRNKILGVYNHRNIQLAFYDTPGFIGLTNSMKKDERILRDLAVEATFQSDVVIILVDAVKRITPQYENTFAEMAKIALEQSSQELILVLNKVDLVIEKYDLLDTTRKLVSIINGVKLGPERAKEACLDTTTFMISASENDGVIDIKNYLSSLAIRKPWVIPKGKGITDMTIQERVEELVLEVLMNHTHDEIPYIADIDCCSITDINSNRVKIDVNIYVDSGAQQKIIIGAKGRTLVKVRQEVVVALEVLFKKDVILFLWVKHRGEEGKSDSSAENFNSSSIETKNM